MQSQVIAGLTAIHSFILCLILCNYDSVSPIAGSPRACDQELRELLDARQLLAWYRSAFWFIFSLIACAGTLLFTWGYVPGYFSPFATARTAIGLGRGRGRGVLQ